MGDKYNLYKIGSEKRSVQDPIIKYLSSSIKESQLDAKELSYQYAYEYFTPDEIISLRNGISNLILSDIFVPQILKLNPSINNQEALEIKKQLERSRPDIEGNLTIWQFLKGIKTFYSQNQKRDLNITLIDTNNISNNRFIITDEFEFTNGIYTTRQDIVLFINGIPVIFIETKSPAKQDAMSEALDQVKRYHSETPELLAIEQIYVLTHLIKFLYGATWNLSLKSLYNWKEEKAGNFEEIVKSFFEPERIVKLITDYILFTRKDDQLQKVILRPHQIRAIEKIIARAEDKQKRRGLIWHTQGSGKTYTMIVAAKKLIENPIFENPTVIMLVDRNELEAQLYGNLQSVGFEYVEVAQSKEHLERLLRNDKRGLIISMIHKFEGMPANIITRDNVFVLVDEAHRTTSGKLGNYLMGALPNATYIGFTGTPIDKSQYGQGTFLIFGKDDPPKGYLDKYSIAESIEDGTTLRLHYSLASNELTIDEELLEKEFLDLKEAEGISDQDELNKILDKAVTLKNAIKSKNRIEKVAEFIAKHFRENVEPLGYKAFVVAVDREACALYKDELDKHLPVDYTQVVFSPFYNDNEFLKKFHLDEEEEKRIRKNFISPEKNPKILIVTNKLLTGFDAPILYCMYLDKPMRDHVLLQTIARVNRPYEDEFGRKKPAGFVVDFIGIFSKLEKALAFDSTDIEGIIDDIEELKERFIELIDKARNEFLEKLQGESPDKKVEFILTYFEESQKREEYYQLYREVIDIYNIISPDEFLRPYIDDVDILTRIYKILKEAYEQKFNVDKELTKKVEELVKKNIKQSEISDGIEIVEINEELINELENQKKSDKEKIFSWTLGIIRTIDKLGDLHYLKSIKEKAEQIVEKYKDHQISTKEALDDLKKLIQEMNEAQKEMIEKQMDETTFTIYWLLKKSGVVDYENIAREIKQKFDDHPHWKASEQKERELGTEIISILLRINCSIDFASDFKNQLFSYLKS